MEREGSRPRTGRPTSSVPPSRSGMMSSAARPITQQGLTGVRPIQTASNRMNRVHKDKRYYMSLMQSHMNVVREELASLRKSTAQYRATGLNRLEARRTAENCARRYAECQETLSVFNVVLEVHASQEKSDKLVYETALLKERNKHVLNELDILVTYKVRREEKIAALKKDITEEDQAVQRLIETFSDQDKIKYMGAVSENKKIVEELKGPQIELNRYKDVIRQYQKTLGKSQIRQRHLQLLQNLSQVISQKDSLSSQLRDTLTPAQKRELLVQQVKDDKIDTESLIKVKSVLEEELKDKKERLTELESELNEKNTARLKKHKELRDRDELMSKFISSFGEKSGNIREKMELVQRNIHIALQVLTKVTIEQNFEELDNIQSNLNQMSLEGLTDQVALYSSRLATLKAFREKYGTELATWKTKRAELEKEIFSLSNPERDRDQMIAERQILVQKSTVLQQTLDTTTTAVVEAERRLTDVDVRLNENEIYQQIRQLEINLENCEKANENLQSTIKLATYSSVGAKKLEEISSLVNEINKKLIKDILTEKYINDAASRKDSEEDRKEGLQDEIMKTRSTFNQESALYHLKKPDSETEILEFDSDLPDLGDS